MPTGPGIIARYATARVGSSDSQAEFNR